MTQKISFIAYPTTLYDFGLFEPPSKIHVLEVDEEFWNEYVIARHNYEAMHQKLLARAKRKTRGP